MGRQLSGAFLSSGMVQLVGMGFTFLVGMQLARYLGPAGYGIYGTVMAVVAILSVLAQCGLPQLSIREVSASLATRDFPRARGVIKAFPLAVIFLLGVIVVAAFALVMLWPEAMSHGGGQAFYWALCILPSLALANLYYGILCGLHQVVRAQLFDVIMRPAIFAGSLLGMVTAFGAVDLSDALKLQAIVSAAILLMSATAVWRGLPRALNGTAPAITMAAWAANAAPMMGTELLRVADAHYGVMLLAFLVPAAEVGAFRVALSIAGFMALPLAITNLVIMPTVARLHAEGDRRRLQKLMSAAAMMNVAATSIMTLALLAVGEPLIVAIFGEGFRLSWKPLVLLGMAYTVSAFFGPAAALLNMGSGEGAVTLAFAVSVSFAMALSFVLVPAFGMSGIALAAIAAQLVRGTLMRRAARRLIRIDPSVVSLFNGARA